MNTRCALLLPGLLAGLTLLSACRSTSMNTVERAEPTGQPRRVNDLRVLTDASLNRKVSIVGVSEAQTPGGLLRVQVELRNLTSSYQRFNYRFQWFDAEGMQVGASTAMESGQIEGQETKYLTRVAPTPECRDFRLQLIEPTR
jgi:uncharacterized protein YcfL